MTHIGHTTTQLGTIWVAVNENGLASVSIGKKLDGELDQKKTATYTKQIAEYLAGTRTTFDLPIDWSILSPFQQKVLKLVAGIPHGKTAAYKDIAIATGKPKASRAIGRANATNPMPLVIPCHRIVSANGSLTGYSATGGLKTKRWLLELERSV